MFFKPSQLIHLLLLLFLFNCSSKKETQNAPPFIDVTTCTPTKPLDELRNEFDYYDGLYAEKFTGHNDEDLVNYDNCIYTPNRKFIFDYVIFRNGGKQKIKAPFATEPDGDHQSSWDFVAADQDDSEKIDNVSIELSFGVENRYQTAAKYRYHAADDPEAHGFNSTSGVAENQMNVWIPPHHDIYFRILELNPFPFIQRPYKIGHRWNWERRIEDFWADDRWKTWKGIVLNKYHYEITGNEKIKTGIGVLDCWVIDAKGEGTLGTTHLRAYFSEQYGFAKLDYTNIDGSKTLFTLMDVK